MSYRAFRDFVPHKAILPTDFYAFPTNTVNPFSQNTFFNLRFFFFFFKDCGKKEKMLVTSIFSFSLQCFLVCQTPCPIAKTRLKELIEWCFAPLSTVLQSYQGDSSQYSCLSWVSSVLGWGSRVSFQRILHRQMSPVRWISGERV